MKHTLTFDSLHLSFGSKSVLSSIYMQCETGNVVGLLGRNGAGKSCLMKIVFGAMPCAYKCVRVDDETLTGNYLHRRLIGYLPQQGFIPASMPLRTVLNLFQLSEQELAQAFPVYADWMNYRHGELSGGYARLFECLVILLAPYKFCILDEPFSGLAPLHIETLKQVIDRQRSSKGIIITDHLHYQVTSLADSLYLLLNGQAYFIEKREDLVDFGYLSSL